MIKSHYNEWGFITNPFQPTALHSDKLGIELLVGRGKEKKQLWNRIASNSGIITIEGENGIGKTSLVNVVSFAMFQESLKTTEEILYMPCIKHFQLTKDANMKEFVDDIYYSIAQTLIKQAEYVKKIRKKIPKTNYLSTWLNSTEIISVSAQIASFGAGESRELNTSDGFSKSGFKREIKNWLNSIFPVPENGGVICMIDNLELLQTSKTAKELLEYLRDELISLSGTRWIFCGSKGIIPSLAASTRLAGYLQKPINIEGVKSIYVSSLLSSRVSTFKSNTYQSSYLPITTEDFVFLYNELNGNIRDTLKKVDDYCMYVYESVKKPDFVSEKSSLFATWLNEDKMYIFDSIRKIVDKEGLKLLSQITEKGGGISQYDIKKLGFTSLKTIMPLIEQLEAAGLVTLPIYQMEEIDRIGEYDDFYDRDFFEEHGSENIAEKLLSIIISPKGWFVNELTKKEYGK